MSGPFCETCKYFRPQPISDWGICGDTTKYIYKRGGDQANEDPRVIKTFECSNHDSIVSKRLQKNLLSEHYACGVVNCGKDKFGNGDCVHKLLYERCHICAFRLVEVRTTGHKFCSNNDSECDWDV